MQGINSEGDYTGDPAKKLCRFVVVCWVCETQTLLAFPVKYPTIKFRDSIIPPHNYSL